jgi:tetratricopeptide (TPR) repeat protein
VPDREFRRLRALTLILLFCTATGCSGILAARTPASVGPPSRPSTVHIRTQLPPGPTRVAPAAAYAHFLKGYLHELRNQDGQALVDYEDALRIDPDSVTLHHRAATLAFRQGRYNVGVTHTEEALELDANHLPSILLLARWYAATGTEFDRAVELFERAASLDPVDLEPYLNLGLLYAKVRRYADAERTLGQALAVDPTSPSAHLYLGRVAAAQKHWNEAETHIERTIELAPFSEAAYIALGDLYLQQGDRDRAVGVYKRLLARVDPRDSEAVGRLIHLYLQDRTFDQAIALLDDLLKADPRNADAHLLKGRIFGEMGKPEAAVTELEQVIAIRPGDTAAIYFLGRLYDELKESDKAIAEFEKIVAMDVDVIEAYLQLGILYSRAKRYEDAQAVLLKAKAKEADRAEVYLVLGFVYSQQELYDRAAAVFEEGLSIHQSNATLHFNLGLAYDKLQQFDRFVTELEEAIRLDPKYAEAMNYLGYTYAEKDMKLGEAMDLIKRALAIKPDDGAYVDSLGWTHFKLGQWDEAVRELERAISLLPDDAVIHEHLGEAYLKKSRRDEARESWLRSLELDPANAKLIERFKTTGFGDPEDEERFQRAKSKKDDQDPAADSQVSPESDPRNAQSGT